MISDTKIRSGLWPRLSFVLLVRTTELFLYLIQERLDSLIGKITGSHIYQYYIIYSHVFLNIFLKTAQKRALSQYDIIRQLTLYI